MNRVIKYYFPVIGFFILTACTKYLDIEPRGKLIPKTVADFRLLLDDRITMNTGPGIAELASDNLFLHDQDLMNIQVLHEKNTYLWNKEIYGSDDQAPDWNIPYRQIYYANLILEGLQTSVAGTVEERNAIEGEALFYRGYALFNVVSLYSKFYDPATADTDLGVPIRESSDVFEKSFRPTLSATYTQILTDLKAAADLLPETQQVKTRPSKTAAYGALAIVYLNMNDYDRALYNALQALSIDNTLIDYNVLDANQFPVFSEFNAETLFFSYMHVGYTYIFPASLTAEVTGLYESNDLRSKLFIAESFVDQNGAEYVSFTGSYAGFEVFTGIATDELYLIVSECYARKHLTASALEYLNLLLEKRYESGSFIPVKVNDETELIKRIVIERRKELLMRNRRWFDLKRLGRDDRFAVKLERFAGGSQYSLAPRDPRYVFPIPFTVIENTGMEQNVR